MRMRRNPLNGRPAYRFPVSYEDARAQSSLSNFWSSSENNGNNAWNINFNSGNTNGNNKYNSLIVRPVAASGDFNRFYESIVAAYEDCLRGKMTSPQAISYMCVAVRDLPILAKEIWTGLYKPSTSTCFLVKYPKIREVFAAAFRDRIVHHWICMRLNPLFEERFIAQDNVSHNCRKGLGTRTAVLRVAEGMKVVSCNYTRPAWNFRGDLTGFFMSIDKKLLLNLLLDFIDDRYDGDYPDLLRRLVSITVLHCPEKDCVFNSDPALWEKLPPKNSLLRNGDDKGEPIGNLTTQLFANFLMSHFDEWAIDYFKGTSAYYTRFVDDFLVTCDDLDKLKAFTSDAEAFLRDVLKLRMHKNKRYLQPVSHGVLFVGSYIKPGRLYLSNRTVARFEERVYGFNAFLKANDPTFLDLERITSVVNSYLGFCKDRQTYNIRRRILTMFEAEFWRYFYIYGHYDKIVIRKKYRRVKL